MALKGRVEKLGRDSKRQMIVPQKDGGVARLPRSEYAKAYKNAWDRLGAGVNAPPEHPLITAARNSSDPKWRGHFDLCDDPHWTTPLRRSGW